MTDPANQPPATPKPRRAIIVLIRHHPLAAVVLLLALYILTLRLWWGWRVDRQLVDQHEEIRRRGEPVLLADAGPGAVPTDGQQAVRNLLLQAMVADSGTSPSNAGIDFPDYPPFGVKWELAADVSERTNASVFASVRKARAIGASASLHADAPSRNEWARSYMPQLRQVASTLADGALCQHIRGNDQEAVERLLDLCFLAEVVREDGSSFPQLIAAGIDALAINGVLTMGPALRLQEPGIRERARLHIAALLEEKNVLPGFRQAIVDERLTYTETARTAAEGTWFIRPAGDRDIVRGNEAFNTYARLIQVENAEDGRRITEPQRARHEAEVEALTEQAPTLLGQDRPWRTIFRYSRWFNDPYPNVSRLYEQPFRLLGERRLAIVAIAIQLYRADHKGRFPDRLSELVPAYLATLPADPFHADGRPIGYVVLRSGLPNGGDRPLLYYDAGGGDEAIVDSEPMYSWSVEGTDYRGRRVVRQYRDLQRWSPVERRFERLEREREREEREQQEREAQERKRELEEAGLLPRSDAPATQPTPTTPPPTPPPP